MQLPEREDRGFLLKTGAAALGALAAGFWWWPKSAEAAPSTHLDDIHQGFHEIISSNFVAGTTKKSYRQANPLEAERVLKYVYQDGPYPVPAPATLMGGGLVKIETALRALAAEPPPPPPVLLIYPSLTLYPSETAP